MEAQARRETLLPEVDARNPRAIYRFLYEHGEELERLGLVSVRRGEGPLAGLRLYIYREQANRPAVFRDRPYMFFTRGTVLGPGGEPVSVPFHKFFNLHDARVLGFPRWAGDERVYLKLDGTLIVVTHNQFTGRPLVHTKGTLKRTVFVEKFVEWARRRGYWEDIVDYTERHPGATLMFELLGDGPPGIWIRLGKTPPIRKRVSAALLAVRPSPESRVVPPPVKDINVPQLHPVEFHGLEELVRFVRHNPSLEGFVTYSARPLCNKACNLMWKVKSIEYMRRVAEAPSRNVYEAVFTLMRMGFRDDILNDPELGRAVEHLERLGAMRERLRKALEAFRSDKEFRNAVLPRIEPRFVSFLFAYLAKGYPKATSIREGERMVETAEKIVRLYEELRGGNT